jgi:hypothetical protein
MIRSSSAFDGLNPKIWTVSQRDGKAVVARMQRKHDPPKMKKNFST